MSRLADEITTAWRYGGALTVYCRHVSPHLVALQAYGPGAMCSLERRPPRRFDGAGDVARWVTDPALVPEGRAALVALEGWS